MADLDDVDLGHGGEPDEPQLTPPRDGLPLGLVAFVVVLVGAIAVVGAFAFRKRAQPSPAPSSPTSALPATSEPGPTPSASLVPLPAGLPALDASDDFVRALGKNLSAHPQFAAWLAAKDLVRTLTVVVENVANGQTPRIHLGFLTPKEPFAVMQKQGRVVIDPHSYARYDELADAFASLDAVGCASVYRRVEPLFEAAYRDLGYPEGGFKAALGRAAAMLEAAPALDGDVGVTTVRRARLVYEYEDRRVENLTAAQKQLVRLGPRNVRKVQAKLHELRAALEQRSTP